MTSIANRLRPYIVIFFIALVAWFPIIIPGFSLKNDALNLDLPFKFFISECIHNGVAPIWFNTWASGFPLQSIFGWNIFNPLQLFLCSIFHYNLFTLHIEFLLYVCLAGWGMYFFLERRFPISCKSLIGLACCYMLSGFVVSSAQFLLFMASLAFLPYLFDSFLVLTERPRFKASIRFAVWFYVCLTSIYPPVLLIASYCFSGIAVYLLFVALRASKWNLQDCRVIRLIGCLTLSAFAVLALSTPFLYYTHEVSGQFARGHNISDMNFLHSNYFHPRSLISFVFPILAISQFYPYTDPTMQNAYCGLACILLILPVIRLVIKRGDLIHASYAVGFILCLLFSMDHYLPFRLMLNGLWGFRLFRSASIFRLFSIFFFLAFIAKYFDEALVRYRTLFIGNNRFYRCVVLLLFIGCGCAVGFGIIQLNTIHWKLPTSSLYYALRDQHNWISLSIASQLLLLSALVLSLRRMRPTWLYVVMITDLLLNTLLAMPFQAISSYSQTEIAAMIKPVSGFPINNNISAGNTIFIDRKHNPFFNFNVFRKQVSAEGGYVGPLFLDKTAAIWHYAANRPQVKFVALDIPATAAGQINIIRMMPDCVEFNYKAESGGKARLLQNYFEGWQATINGIPAEIDHADDIGMEVNLPPGQGRVAFRFAKPFLLWSAIFSSMVIALYFLGMLVFSIPTTFAGSRQFQSRSANSFT